MGEFELIERFFSRQRLPEQAGTSAVVLGIGDDCALLTPTPGQHLAISTDMLLEGRHFFANVDPESLGHKALAVNLSDLAAMGAEPLAFTLALALPPERASDHAWLDAFAQGLFALSDTHACPLAGGDTTAGPLNLCLTVFGQVPPAQALRRDGARTGDDIWVSGTLGDARLALGALRGEWTLPPERLTRARQRLERPTPRLALGLALRGIASAAADISDGLAGDLGHILKASGVGACLNTTTVIELIASGERLTNDSVSNDAKHMLHIILTGGDDYELVFTASPAARTAVQTAARQAATPVTRIGRIETAPGLRLIDAHGHASPFAARAFEHFGNSPD